MMNWQKDDNNNNSNNKNNDDDEIDDDDDDVHDLEDMENDNDNIIFQYLIDDQRGENFIMI